MPVGVFVGLRDVRLRDAGRADADGTNEVVVGAVLDDNSQTVGFLQAGLGFITGAPMEDKSFPLPSTPEVAANRPVR